MAEFVSKNIEELLPQIIEAVRVQILSAEESRAINKKRETLEYRLQRREKTPEIFQEYIEYEKDLLALIKKRRGRLGITVKRQEIDIEIVKHIHSLYRLMCRRFFSDVSLWKEHIQFCRERKERKSASKVYSRMLQFHNKKPELWVEAAQLEVKLKKLPEARSLILTGLRFNPGSQVLLLKLFQMELSFASELWKDWEVRRRVLEETVEEPPSLKHAKVVMQQTIEQHPEDLGLLRKLLAHCNKYTFTDELKDFLYKRVEEQHSNQPQAWDLLARRHLQAHAMETDEAQKSTLEQLAIMKYESAVSQINTEAMWDLYLAACLEMLEWEGGAALIHLRVKRVVDVCKRADDLKLLSANGYLHWVRVLSRTGQVRQVTKVTALGTKQHPDCPQLWLARLHHLAETLALPSDLHDVFQAARQALPDKEALPIWEAYLSYLAMHNDDAMLESLFKEGVKAGREVAQHCKPVFLQWTFLQRGLQPARALFKSLSQTKPCPLVVYQRYLAMELCQVEVNMERIRRAFDMAFHEYGADHPELWASLIALELFHPRGDAARVGEVNFAAKATLKPGLVERFQQLRMDVETQGQADPSACLRLWSQL